MSITTLLKAIKCLRHQNEEAQPDADWLRFREAYIVGEEIYLARGAADIASKCQGRDVEVLTYAEAHQYFLTHQTNNVEDNE